MGRPRDDLRFRNVLNKPPSRRPLPVRRSRHAPVRKPSPLPSAPCPSQHGQKTTGRRV